MLCSGGGNACHGGPTKGMRGLGEAAMGPAEIRACLDAGRMLNILSLPDLSLARVSAAHTCQSLSGDFNPYPALRLQDLQF